MKRITALLIACLIVVFGTIGCSSTTSSSSAPSPAESTAPAGSSGPAAPAESAGGEYADYYKGKNVSMIVCYAAGGGADIGTRVMVPYLEEILGCTITVENITGGGGWIGWEDLLSRPADGLTLSNVNNTSTLTGYLNPEFERTSNLDSFDWIANMVNDYICIFINPNDTRYTNIEELIEYAKDNVVTVGTSGIGTAPSCAIHLLNNALGTQFVEVAAAGWTDTSAALIGGHIDAAGATVGESKGLVADGQIVATTILAEERSELQPDVPTLLEVTGEEVFVVSTRGYATAAGTPQELLDILADAFEKTAQNQEFVAAMAELGYYVHYIGGTEYQTFIKGEEETLRSLSDVFGWT